MGDDGEAHLPLSNTPSPFPPSDISPLRLSTLFPYPSNPPPLHHPIIPHLPLPPSPSLQDSNPHQGDPNASIPTIQPLLSRPQFAPLVPSTSITFVSAASLPNVSTYSLRKRIEPVKNCRTIGKKDMKYNDAMPKMEVDAERYDVRADGVRCVAEPAETLPLTQAMFIY